MRVQETQETQETPVAPSYDQYRVSLSILGTKKRARKSRFHSYYITTCDLDADTGPLEDKGLARMDSEMSNVITAWLVLDHVTICGDTETYAPFSDRSTKLRKTILIKAEDT